MKKPGLTEEYAVITRSTGKECHCVRPKSAVTGVSFHGPISQQKNPHQRAAYEGIEKDNRKGAEDRCLTDGFDGTVKPWQEAPFIKNMSAACAGKPAERQNETMVIGLDYHWHKNRSGVDTKQEEREESAGKERTAGLLREYAAKSGLAAECKKESVEPAGGVYISGHRTVSAGSENHSPKAEMYCRYGIRNGCNTNGAVRMKGLDADRFLSDRGLNFSQEPRVCPVEERQRIRKEKQETLKESSSGNKSNSRKKSGYAGYVKLAMVRDLILQEGMQEEGKKASLGQLIGQMAKYEGSRLLRLIGGKMQKLLGYIAAAVLPVLLLAAYIILPIALLLGFLMHPVSFFLVDYGSDETLAGNPKYIKNAVQEMYMDFHGGISAFSDSDEHNQVVYVHGNIPNTDAVLSVYLSRLCERADYEGLTDGGDTFQPYLLVDTDTEERLLKQVFGEFNHMEVQEIIIQAEDGNAEADAAGAAERKQEGNQTREDHKQPEEETKAKKMTVYCLSLGQWKALFESSLSAGEQKLLALLEEHAGNHAEGNGAYIPITDITIPEGADQNLIYMAAFIKAEAGNQSFQGQVAVAYVILNRSGGPSGDIIGVLTAPYQFSCYIPFHTVEKYIEEYASMTEEQKSSDSCYLAAAGAYTGANPNPIEDIKYYCNPKACSAGEGKQWTKIRAKNSVDDIIIIGDHVFCRYCW